MHLRQEDNPDFGNRAQLPLRTLQVKAPKRPRRDHLQRHASKSRNPAGACLDRLTLDIVRRARDISSLVADL